MKFVDLAYENKVSESLSIERDREIADSGKYLMGENAKKFSKVFSTDQDVKNCVLLKNATDALAMTFIHLRANERTVIVPQFGAYPTVVAALQAGAKEIIGCAVDDTLTMDLTGVNIPKGSIIVPVNLFGNECNIKKIREAVDTVGGCTIVEDCAQSTGIPNSGLSDFMVHSFYPTKPLGCRGDGGAVLTNDDFAADCLNKSKFYGLNQEGLIDTWGMNSRIDEWQSSHLLSKVHLYREMNNVRRKNAFKYACSTVKYTKNCVYHQYVCLFKDRDTVKNFFTSRGIPTMIHYPMMLRDMPYLKDKVKFTDCKKVSNHVLSLPVGPHLTNDDTDLIVETLQEVMKERIHFEDID